MATPRFLAFRFPSPAQRILQQGLKNSAENQEHESSQQGLKAREDPDTFALCGLCSLAVKIVSLFRRFVALLCPFLFVGPRIGLILFMFARWFRSFPYASHNLDFS
jgi:hypothetical protein